MQKWISDMETNMIHIPTINFTTHLVNNLHESRIRKRKAFTVRRFNIQDQIKSVIIIGNLAAQTTQIEIVLDVILINFTEKLISTQTAKPWDPWRVLPIRPTNIWFLTIRFRFLCYIFLSYRRKETFVRQNWSQYLDQKDSRANLIESAIWSLIITICK